jgi:hypothetical protein
MAEASLLLQLFLYFCTMLSEESSRIKEYKGGDKTYYIRCNPVQVWREHYLEIVFVRWVEITRIVSAFFCLDPQRICCLLSC